MKVYDGFCYLIVHCLHPQIEELTSTLPPQHVQTSSTSSVDSSNSTEATSPPVKRKPRLSFQAGAKKALLKWVQKTATKYEH